MPTRLPVPPAPYRLATAALALTLAACDSDSGAEPPEVVPGVYEGEWRDEGRSVRALLRLDAEPDGGGYSADRSCWLVVFGRSDGCSGQCTLSAPIRPKAKGFTTFSLRLDAENPFATGDAFVAFNVTVEPDGQALVGTADARCSFPGRSDDQTLDYPRVPITLRRLPDVE